MGRAQLGCHAGLDVGWEHLLCVVGEKRVPGAECCLWHACLRVPKRAAPHVIVSGQSGTHWAWATVMPEAVTTPAACCLLDTSLLPPQPLQRSSTIARFAAHCSVLGALNRSA